MAQQNFKKDDPSAKYLAMQQKEDRKNKDVIVGGVSYTIKKWKHTKTLQMLPSFANLLYVPNATMGADVLQIEEGMHVENPTTLGETIAILFSRLEEMDVELFFKAMLSDVFIKGNTKPIDIDEDLENPLDIIKLMEEVATANFLIGLCQTISASATTMVAAQQMNDSLQPTKS